MLEQFGISPTSCNAEKMNAQYQALQKQKSELTSTYRSCEKESNNLEKKLSKLKQYLGQDSVTVAKPENQLDKKDTPAL